MTMAGLRSAADASRTTEAAAPTERKTRWLPALLVAAMVLAPYPAVAIPFQKGLLVQLSILVACVALAAWRSGRRLFLAPRMAPPAVRMGLALYASGALWGAGVGILSGNPARYIASQTVAFILLPLSAWAFLESPGHGAEASGRGLAAGALLMAGLHLGVVAVPSLRTTLAGGHLRFFLRNDAHAMGAVVLLLALLAARWAAQRTAGRGLALAAALVLVVGSQTRGAWISGTVAVAIVISLSSRRPWRRLLVTGLSVVLATLTLLGLAYWSKANAAVVYDLDAATPGRPAELPLAVPSRLGQGAFQLAGKPTRWQGLTLGRGLFIRGAAIELTVTATVPPGRRAYAWLKVLDANGAKLFRAVLPLGSKRKWTRYSRFVPLPAQAAKGELGLSLAPGQGELLVRRVNLNSYSSPWAAWLRQAGGRLLRPLQALARGSKVPDLSYRARELRAVWGEWNRGPLGRLLVGHGLGATFPFVNAGWDDHGHRIRLERASYIHNYYVMLAFKLGLGGVAALVGLLMVVVWTYRRARKYKGSEGWFLTGMAAAWGAYLVWSMTSPEIYDFRMAPLWGALVAACLRASGEASQSGSLPVRNSSGRGTSHS